MNRFESRTTPRFRECLNRLPAEVQEQAVKQYLLFSEDPFHPSLRLKEMQSLWSVRVTRSYRAVATRQGNTFTWFWIGPHEKYEQMLKS